MDRGAAAGAAFGAGGAFTELIGGLLKNPLIIEGLIAGASAFAASQKTKRINSGEPQSGFDLTSILSMLPQLLPLLGMFGGSGTGASGIGSDAISAAINAAENENADETKNNNDSNIAAVNALSNDSTGASETDAAEIFGGIHSGITDEKYEKGEDEETKRQRQRESLLLAIRPYLSPSRQSAADAMIEVSRYSGLFMPRDRVKTGGGKGRFGL